MKDEHILEILDRQSFGELNAEEKSRIDAHAARCASCAKAFEAARVSALMLKAGAETLAVEPSPFFEAKLISALRARQNLSKPMAAFRRWWQASFAPVCAMLFLVIGLIGLSFLAPGEVDDEAQAIAPNNLYTTDAVIMNQRTTREMTNEQVFRVIYNPRYDAADKK